MKFFFSDAKEAPRMLIFIFLLVGITFPGCWVKLAIFMFGSIFTEERQELSKYNKQMDWKWERKCRHAEERNISTRYFTVAIKKKKKKKKSEWKFSQSTFDVLLWNLSQVKPLNIFALVLLSSSAHYFQSISLFMTLSHCQLTFDFTQINFVLLSHPLTHFSTRIHSRIRWNHIQFPTYYALNSQPQFRI